MNTTVSAYDGAATPRPPRTAAGLPRAPALIRAAFRLAGMVLPGTTAEFVGSRILTPRRKKPRTEPILRAARVQRVLHGADELVTYAWGSRGPTALLAHGWEGCAQDWAALVPVLLTAGYRVIAFDSPAHGASGGLCTDVHDIARAIGTIVRADRPPAVMVAHSIGAAAAAVYLSEHLRGPLPERLVLMAPGGDLAAELASVAAALGLNAATLRALRAFMECRYGRAIEACSTRAALAGVPTRLLLVHDEHDRVVPAAVSRELHGAQPHARLLLTTGLGHRRILADPAVLAEIAAFCSGTDALERAGAWRAAATAPA